MSKNKRSLIDSVEVRVPCSARWEEMLGNDRVRFCDHCATEVKNLSAITRKEAMHLVRQSRGKLCIRYVPDTNNRPVFADSLVRITRHHPRLAAGVLAASLGMQSMAYAQAPDKQTDAAAVVAEQEKSQKDYEASIEHAAKIGAVDGVIRDVSGESVRGVQMMLTRSGEYGGDDAVTDEAGHFSFTNLEPGVYILRVLSSTGTWKRAAPNIEVIAANTTRQDIGVRVVHSKPDGPGTGGGPGFGMGGAMAYIPYSLPLSQAVDSEDLDKVNSLLQSGARVNGKEPSYSNITPLFIAVEKGNLEIARLLIRYGAKVDARDKAKRTPLMSIDDDATPELVKLLIDAGASVSAKDESGFSPVFAAVETGKPEVLSVIAAAGGDINAADDSRMTPLMRAVESRKVEIVDTLIRLGADVNATDEDGSSAWEMSFDTEIDALLVAAGATVTYDVTVDPERAKEDDTSNAPADEASPTPTPMH